MWKLHLDFKRREHNLNLIEQNENIIPPSSLSLIQAVIVKIKKNKSPIHQLLFLNLTKMRWFTSSLRILTI